MDGEEERERRDARPEGPEVVPSTSATEGETGEPVLGH